MEDILLRAQQLCFLQAGLTALQILLDQEDEAIRLGSVYGGWPIPVGLAKDDVNGVMWLGFSHENLNIIDSMIEDDPGIMELYFQLCIDCLPWGNA